MFSLTLDSSPFREAILLPCPNNWSRKWQPTPVFLPAKFRGQRSLGDCSPWGHKELDPTELLSMSTLKIFPLLVFPCVTHWFLCHPPSLAELLFLKKKHQHYYISHVDDFSKPMGLGNVSLKPSPFTECKDLICFMFVQRGLLKQGLLEEVLVCASYREL